MSKRILIINGHPDQASFNYGLADAYRQGAAETGATIQEITIAQLQFDPNLRYGYRKRIDLEPDLLTSLDKIRWAEHLVWVHPVWWGGLPALMKGFIDRLFLPGIAFQYRTDSVWWDKLFAGKTAHIITTVDQPAWYYWLVFGNPSVNQLKRSVLEFCGIKPVHVTYIGAVRNSTEQQRARWLQSVSRLGRQLK
ncbi:MAG: flavodoxin family protein [Cytophagales bacterium]|nr:MAG: flavodoxin family protein [Cytophagales bacterium]